MAGFGSLPFDFWVEWAPAYGIDDVVPVLDWVRINLPIRQLSLGHGVNRTIGRTEVGTFSVVMGDPGRDFDPWNRQGPNWALLQNRHPIRVAAKVNLIASPTYLIRGYAKDWVPDWYLGDVTVTLTGVDVLGPLSKRIEGTVFDRVAAALLPDYWLALDEGGGVVSYPKQTAAGVNIGGPGLNTTTAAGGNLMPYGDQPSITFPQIGSHTDVLMQADVQLPNNMTIVCIVNSGTASSSAQVLVSGGSYDATQTPFGDVALVINDSPPATGGNTVLYVGNATGRDRFNLVGASQDVPTMYIARVTPTTLALDATQNETIGGATQTRTAGQAPRPGGIRLGNTMNPALDKQLGGSMSHFLLWNRTLSDTERADLHKAFVIPLRSQLSSDHVNWILNDLGLPAGRRSVEVGQQTMGSLRLGAPALELLERITTTERGRFFGAGDGTLTFYARNHVPIVRGTYDTRPPSGSTNAALAEMTPTADERTFYNVAQTTVATPTPLVVEYRHPNAALDGEVLFSAPTQYASATVARDAAIDLVGDGSPNLAIVGAKIIGGALNVTWDDQLTFDVTDIVNLVGRIPNDEDVAPGGRMEWGVAPFWCTRRTDTFTRAAGAIGSTEGDQSQAWSTTGATWSVTALGRASRTGVGGVHHHATLAMDGTDHEITALLSTTTNAQAYVGLVARYVDTSNYYLLQFEPAGMYLYKNVAGVLTALVIAPVAVASVLNHNWTLRCVGSTITLLYDGAFVASVTDTALTTGIRAGLSSLNSGAADIERWDNVVAQSYPNVGWGGPGPLQRAGGVLYVRHDVDGVGLTWHTVLDLEGVT